MVQVRMLRLSSPCWLCCVIVVWLLCGIYMVFVWYQKLLT